MTAERKAAPAAEKALSGKLKLTSVTTGVDFWLVGSSTWPSFNIFSGGFPSKSTLVAAAAPIQEGSPGLELTIPRRKMNLIERNK